MATRVASGWVRKRWMVRFSSRAPYSALVPFSSRNWRVSSGTSSVNERSPSRVLTWFCRSAICWSRIVESASGDERLIGDDAIDAVDEFRRKALADGHHCDAPQLAGEIRPVAGAGRLEAEIRVISRNISREPRLLVRKTRLFSKLTEVLSPSRRIPLSSTPSSRRVREGAAFSISSNKTNDRSHFSLVTALSFCCVSMGWVSR